MMKDNGYRIKLRNLKIKKSTQKPEVKPTWNVKPEPGSVKIKNLKVYVIQNFSGFFPVKKFVFHCP